jgi:diadenosine tetraphosphate (Ap4A) HIT family hydrolase
VARTERFVAVPSIGPLVPGWLLVIPTTHYLSFAQLETSEEIVDELREIADWWQHRHGPLTWFEHGPSAEGSLVGCGVDHAHMHLVPLQGFDLLLASRRQRPSLPFEPIDGPSDITEKSDGEPYLYLQDEAGGSWLARSEEIPSQFFRRLIAAEQGRPEEFDWKRFPHRETLSLTLSGSERHAAA